MKLVLIWKNLRDKRCIKTASEKEVFEVKNSNRSLRLRLLACVACCMLFIAVPALIVHNTNSNGLGAGLFAITMFCGLPVSSLICGVLSAPDPKKLWILPVVPSAVYFLFFPILTDAYLSYRLAQFSGLLFGYGAFALGLFIMKKRDCKK